LAEKKTAGWLRPADGMKLSATKNTTKKPKKNQKKHQKNQQNPHPAEGLTPRLEQTQGWKVKFF